LQEKRDGLTQKKTEIEKADILPSIKANATKSIDAEISAIDNQVSEMQKTGNPLEHENDNLTGEPIVKPEEPKTDVATTEPKSEPTPIKEESIESKKANIEKRRQEELDNSIPVQFVNQEKMFGRVIQKEGWAYGTAGGISKVYPTKPLPLVSIGVPSFAVVCTKSPLSNASFVLTTC